MDDEGLNYKYYLKGEELKDNYIIKEGDRIYKEKMKKINREALKK